MSGGRPLKFQSVEELTKQIDEYFALCEENNKPLTITGLALSLDTNRQTLLEYEGEVKGREKKDPAFADTIKKAKLIVENGYEIDLKKSGRSGTIFALKNFDWKDKTETDITTKGEKIDSSDTIKELAKEINALHRRTSVSSDGIDSNTVDKKASYKE